MKILMLSLFVLTIVSLHAEFDTVWSMENTAPVSDYTSTCILPMGNILCAGTYEGQTPGLKRSLISGYHPSGQSWFNYLNTDDAYNSISEIISKPNGSGFVTIGRKMTSDNGYQLWFATWNLFGNLVSQRLIGGAGEEIPNSIITSGDGGYYIAGSVTSQNETFRDIGLWKVNANGDSLWFRQYGYEGNDEGKQIIADGSGHLYLVGATSASLSVRNSDLLILKLDNSGNVLNESAFWVLGSGAVDYDAGYSICLHEDGSLTATGCCSLENGERMDIAVVHTDANLNLLWRTNRELLGFYDIGYKVVPSTDSNEVILCGSTRSLNDRRGHGFILRLDAQGNQRWFTTFDSDGSNNCLDVKRTPDGNYLLAGYAYDANGIRHATLRKVSNSYLLPDIAIEPSTGQPSLRVGFHNHTLAYPVVSLVEWDFQNDGIFDATGDSASFIYPNMGVYDVAMHIVNPAADTVLVFPGAVHIFNGDSSVSFNEITSSANILATPDLELSSGFTVEAWIKPNTWGQNPANGATIFDKGVIKLGIKEFDVVDSCMSISIQNEGTVLCQGVTGINTIRLDVWQNLAVTYNATTGEAVAYINGIPAPIIWMQIPSGQVAANAANSITLGTDPTGVQVFQGCLDEVRLWNYARSENEIVSNLLIELAGTEPGLIGYWPMNEGNGNVVNDITVGVHTAALTDIQWQQGHHLSTNAIEDNQNPSNRIVQCIESVYPNPCNPSVTIVFNLASKSAAKLSIYNIRGQEVKNLVSDSLTKGQHIVTWDGKDHRGKNIGSGVYLIRLSAGNVNNTTRVVLLR